MRFTLHREPPVDAPPVEIPIGNGEPALIPARVAEDFLAALMPALMAHGPLTLTVGAPQVTYPGPSLMVTSIPLAAARERPRGIVTGSARRGDGKALDQVVSSRFGSPLLAKIRESASADGISVSDWLRDAASARLADLQAPTAPAPIPEGLRVTGWSCAHISMSAGGAVTLQPSAGCGCEMQPLYAAA